MLDSSPVRLPKVVPPSRPLKRTSSSVSLPLTPPQTEKRKPRAKLRRTKSDHTASESEDVVEPPAKRRRLSQAIPEVPEEFDDEDTFWRGNKKPKHHGKNDMLIASPVAEQSPSPPSSPVPVVVARARLRAQSTTSSLASPPPSYRQAKPSSGKKAVVFASPTLELPRTPKRSFSPPVLIDDPDNPFGPNYVETEEAIMDRLSRANTESPFVTFVYRGVRKQFKNPYYDPDKKGPVSPPPNSLLPTDHPDFSPDTRCAPKVLFPEAHIKNARIAAKKRKAADKVKASGKGKASLALSALEEDDGDSDSDGECEVVMPTKLFAKELGRK